MIGPLIGFINVTLIELTGLGIVTSPVAVFAYVLAAGVALSLLFALIVIFVRVQPIIVSLSGFLALSGLNLVILPRPGGSAPEWMSSWGSGTAIFSPVLFMVALATAGWLFFSTTAFYGHLRSWDRTSAQLIPAVFGSASLGSALTQWPAFSQASRPWHSRP